MHIFYGLVVSLIGLKAFVGQCDAMDPSGSGKRGFVVDNVPTEVLARIFSESGIKATKRAAHSQLLLNGAVDGMIEIFKNHILLIDAATTKNDPKGHHDGNYKMSGRIYSRFESYAELTSLFEKFGPYARRISLDYDGMDISIRRYINKNIVNKYANQFTELYISTRENDSRIWTEMSNGNGQFQFPNVRKFHFRGKCGNSRLDLNKIFPKLEYVKLGGNIGNSNCLANVRNLKELGLCAACSMDSIRESQLGAIFKNNRNITRINVVIKKKETLQFIEEYLKNLQTLKIEDADSEFLIGSNRVYDLASVTSFVIVDYETRKLEGFMSLKMPKLKRLKIYGQFMDKRITKFINHFESLDTVQIESLFPDNTLKYIGLLKNVKQFICRFYCANLDNLYEDFFESFDEAKSKLKSLKLLCIGKLNKPEETMNEINDQLIKSNKSTWTLKEYNREYLIIERNS